MICLLIRVDGSSGKIACIMCLMNGLLATKLSVWKTYIGMRPKGEQGEKKKGYLYCVGCKEHIPFEWWSKNSKPDQFSISAGTIAYKTQQS